MKRLLLATSILALLALGVGVLRTVRRSPVERESAIPPEPPPAVVDVRLQDDGPEVFRRAFWREPAAEDRIIQAERREWEDPENGGLRWRWCLEVQPGAALSTWLRESNPFHLTQVAPSAFRTRDSLPTWFPAAHAQLAGCELQQSADQSADHGMTLIFDSSRNRIYATDSGGGFAVRPKQPVALRPVPVRDAASQELDWKPGR